MSQASITLELDARIRRALDERAALLNEPAEQTARDALALGVLLSVPSAELVERLRVTSRLPLGQKTGNRWEPTPARAEMLQLIQAVGFRVDHDAIDDYLAVIDDSVDDPSMLQELARTLRARYRAQVLIPALMRTFETMRRRAPETTLVFHRAMIDSDDRAVVDLYIAELASLKARSRSALRTLLATDDGYRPERPRQFARVKRTLA